MKPNKLISVILISIIAVLSLACAAGNLEQAKQLYEAGEYEKAFEKLNGIDSEEAVSLANECQRHIDYENAIVLYEKGKKREALTIFENLGDFLDSKEYVVAIYNDKADTALYEEKAYEEAAELYKKAGNTEMETKCLDYIEAKKLIEAGDYAKAAELLRKLGDFEDSEELYGEAQKNVLADYVFIEDLRKAVLERMEKAAAGNVTTEVLINMELVHLEKYKDAAFYDEKLEELAKKYIEGLNAQKEAVNRTEDYANYEGLTRGRILCDEVLTELYNDYGFEKDNTEFAATYIFELSGLKAEYAAFQEIEEDLSGQLDAADVKYDWVTDDELHIIIHNNTKYTYDSEIDFWFYDKKGVLLCNSHDKVTNIKPDTDAVFVFNISNGADVLDNYEYRTYEYNIVLPED